MSNIIVEICKIEKILNHNNAQNLDLAVIKGWQTVVRKGEFKPNDIVIYFPPDTVVSKELTDKWGVSNYCSEKPEGMRIRQARLRGEPSFGLVIRPDDAIKDLPIGSDVAAFYGAKKYEPPVLGQGGDILGSNHALFQKFTDIQNMRNFPDVFQDGEEVIATEKLHGTQVRLSLITENPTASDPVKLWFAGSKEWPRKKPETEEGIKSNFYWYPYSIPGIRDMLEVLSHHFHHSQVVLFGETFGRVQSLQYGLKGLAFRAFALLVDGKYLNRDDFERVCTSYGVEFAPVIYRGPFSLVKIKEVAEGKSMISTANHIREGVVVQPVIERNDPRIGRVILKYVSDNYLLSNYHENDTTDT